MAGPTANDQPVPTSTTNTTRVIPGLSSQPLNSSASKRSRKKKVGTKIDDTIKTATPTINDDANEVTAPAPAPVIASLPEPLNGFVPSVQPVSASVSISPVQQVQKRIRAATKKLQRISGYESSTVPLNEDQKRAIASKPALDATVKELQDLLKILEEDEKLDELRIQAVREEEEVKVKGRVDSAVLSEQKKAETNLTFLLQFLHLYSLVNSATRPTDSFAPPVISPVIQNATAQELAAVNALFHRLADGPIAGGDGDAFDSIDQFTQGSIVDVIEGVSFAKVKEMVSQLSASPAEFAPPPQIPSSTQEQSQVEEEAAPVNPSAPLGNMMFLQQSEVMPPVSSPVTENHTPAPVPEPQSIPSHPVQIVEKEPAVDHVARNKQLLEQATIITPDHLSSNLNDWAAGEQSQLPQLQAAPVSSQEWSTPAEHLSATQAEVVARTIDWAEDVQGQGEAQPNHLTTNFTPVPPPPSHIPGDLAAGQLPLGPPHHHMNNPRGHYRGRGGYRGGPGMPRGGSNHDGYRGGRGWYRGNPGGYRGGREGPPPMDANGPGGWRPGPGGPPEANGGYRPRADYPGGRYGGHRGGPRGGGPFHRPPPPPSQVYHQEVATGPGGNMY